MGYIGVITHLLTFDPNFLGHPSRRELYDSGRLVPWRISILAPMIFCAFGPRRRWKWHAHLHTSKIDSCNPKGYPIPTWNPNGAPCFCWKGPCFGGFFSPRGQTCFSFFLHHFCRVQTAPLKLEDVVVKTQGFCTNRSSHNFNFGAHGSAD